jgi:mannose-6-phosphate isomerase
LILKKKKAMKNLYPLSLSGVTKSPIWGGTRLPREWNKPAPDGGTVGESWELTVRQKEMSTVQNGALAGITVGELLRECPTELMGKTTISNGEFPLLIKFIDAADRLSVQVHPDDTYAARVEKDRGKTEMWYIVDADEDAEIICGLTEGFDNAAFVSALQKGELMSALGVQKVKAGETYFIPSGMVHAICKGILIAEIQQNSNITYRVYDYNRVGADGKLRELHVEDALAVIGKIEDPAAVCAESDDAKGIIAKCGYFTVYHFENKAFSMTAEDDSFVHLLCLGGEAEIAYEGGKMTVSKGESVFVPAGFGAFSVTEGADIVISTL